jgi:hypothetical protein
VYHFNKVACVYQPKALLRLCVLLHPNCILSYIFSAFHDFLYWGAVFSLDDWDLNAVRPSRFGSDCQQWQRCILGSFRFPLPWTFIKRFGMNHYSCAQRCLLHCSSLLLQWSIWVLNSSKFLGVWIWVWIILQLFLFNHGRLSICENSILEEVDSKCGGSLAFSDHKEKGVFVFALRPLLGTPVDICTNRSCTIWHKTNIHCCMCTTVVPPTRHGYNSVTPAGR